MQSITAKITVLEGMRKVAQQIRASGKIDVAEVALEFEKQFSSELEDLYLKQRSDPQTPENVVASPLPEAPTPRTGTHG
ncbi:MAG: hypothetical protein ACFUZC_04840 [Chthoniobacteraceae bacterium]